MIWLYHDGQCAYLYISGDSLYYNTSFSIFIEPLVASPYMTIVEIQTFNSDK